MQDRTPPIVKTIGHVVDRDSGQALPRRTQDPVYRCFLPDLAGFAGLHRVGPDPLYHNQQYGTSSLAEGRNSTPL